MRPDQFSPEEGVMLDADLPQLLGSSVIRELKADCTFKLLVLEEREGRDREKCEQSCWGYKTKCPYFVLLKGNSVLLHRLKFKAV